MNPESVSRRCPPCVLAVATFASAFACPAGKTSDHPTELPDHLFYSPDLAFVVRLRRDAEMGAGLYLGRVPVG